MWKWVAGIGTAATATVAFGKDVITGLGIFGAGGSAQAARENLEQTEKFASITTGVRGFFVGIMEFFKTISELLKGGFKGIMNGTTSASKALSSANNRDGTPPSNSPPGQDKSLTQTFTGYAKGLVADADPRQWTIKGTLNLANAAGNGAVVGTTSTLAWVGGQALDILNVGNVFSDTDFSTKFSKATSEETNKLWEKTIGGPDLNGHWAHALNRTSEFAVPAMGALKIGKALSKAFGFANATTRTGGLADKVVTNAPTLTTGMP